MEREWFMWLHVFRAQQDKKRKDLVCISASCHFFFYLKFSPKSPLIATEVHTCSVVFDGKMTKNNGTWIQRLIFNMHINLQSEYN